MSSEQKILVVEDSETQALALAYALENEGIQVTIAADSDKAFQALMDSRFDAVIIDYHLPGMRGDELCRRIRQNISTRSLPIVMLTAVNTSEVSSIDSGADIYLSKPIDTEILVMRLNALYLKGERLPKEGRLEGIALRQAKILAVDDSPTYLAYLVNLLTDEGYQVFQAGSGQEALDLLKNEIFDGIVLDLVMPGMDGIEVCKWITHYQSHAADPIVMLLLTANENKDEMTRGLAAGADDFVGKSSDLAVLKARIRALIRRKFLQDENKRITEELKNKELETLRARAKQEVAEARASLVEKLELTAKELRISNDELVKAREVAFKASDAKSQFLANMSHEIRTPINGVIGMTTLLEDTRLDTQQADYVENIKRSAEALLTVINDILDFSKVEAGKLELEIVEFDLDQLIMDVGKTLDFSITKKGLRLIISKPDSLTTLFGGDPGRLRQILLNLLSNAIKFTMTGGIQLRIGIEEENDLTTVFKFEVEDSGIGIPQSAIGRMFMPFSQADATTTRKFGGTGLGLSICKRLVELMHGQINVSSIEGKGSVFWFTIPLQKSISKRNTKSEVLAPLTRGLTGRILVAEDNFINQKVALGMLERMGHKAVAVANGVEALNSLREMHFDLILMDCQMPEMDGYETTSIIRRGHTINSPSIPIIAMTANAILGDKERCLASGMDDYISKPVRIDKLALAIGKWLKPPVLSDISAKVRIDSANEMTALDDAKFHLLEKVGVGASRGLVSELVSNFIATTPQALNSMHDAIKAGKLQDLVSIAQALKSSSARLGAIKFSKICAGLENTHSLENTAVAHDLLEELKLHFIAVKNRLEQKAQKREDVAS
ncbi:MAG TPA: response regulator [Oligoflexus sp.]|uniref:response regulator n=1 Tax=Oligoflexus sp. TaxID=1971216 RepID=UPI002D4FF482|nr:response regulator [Oligoflexus sp.]HYX31473.1 response regulator [Oligoflexus sp.]